MKPFALTYCFAGKKPCVNAVVKAIKPSCALVVAVVGVVGVVVANRVRLDGEQEIRSCCVEKFESLLGEKFLVSSWGRYCEEE